MTFRRRLRLVTLLVAAAVAIAIAAAAYLATRSLLLAQVDRALATAIDLRVAATNSPGRRLPTRDVLREVRSPRPPIPTLTTAPLLFTATLTERPGLPLRIGELTLPTAVQRLRPGRSAVVSTRIAGQRVRMLARRSRDGRVRIASQPLADVDRTLRDLRLVLGGLVALALGAALAGSRLLRSTTLTPLRTLTAAATHVADTRDLQMRVSAADGDSELDGMARAFNTMLDALHRTALVQQQLVADASHELRTPLTSVRTNIELLLGEHELGHRDAAATRDAIRAGLGELSVLVDDLLQAARADAPISAPEAVALGELAEDALRRARRLHPRAGFRLVLDEPAVVRGDRDRLARALNNLLDNAVRHAGPEAEVQVAVARGVVVVDDDGPGFADRDLPHVFDRFYRASDVRSAPGSGLGLAIVRGVADAHGGSVEAANRPDRGARLELRLPAAQALT